MRHRLLSYRWNFFEQESLLQLPFVEWTWLLHYKQLHPPPPGRINYAAARSVLTYKPGEFDAAVLHLDSSCLQSDVWEHGKAVVYRDLDNLIQDVPKIVLLHGMPQLRGREDRCLTTTVHTRVREMLGTNHAVVSSAQAADRWGIGELIPHAVRDEGLPLQAKLPQVATGIGLSTDRQSRGERLLWAVRRELAVRGLASHQIGCSPIWADRQRYRAMLSRSLIYFTSTDDSPMPHARTEAMLFGCCVVTTPTHDAVTFIEDGVNGFICNWDAKAIVDLFEKLLADPELTTRIGERGRSTATRLFTPECAAERWEIMLRRLLGPA